VYRGPRDAEGGLRGLWPAGCARGEVEVRGLGGLGMPLFGVSLGWRKTSVTQLPWTALDSRCKVLQSVLNLCHEVSLGNKDCFYSETW
jgi:hypothetical protein